MDYFPLFLDLRQQPCLVVGGGDIALRKTQALIRAQASVILVAPHVRDDLENLLESNNAVIHYREFKDSDVTDKKLVIAATDDEQINEAVSLAAKQLNILVNVVDSPNLSTAIMPSIVDRNPIIVAISSAGKAPILARQARAKIETLLPAAYGELAALAGQFRDRVKNTIKNLGDRRYFWESILEGLPAERFMRGDKNGAKELIEKQIESFDQRENVGEVYLVGAGPGDPDLLTFKALRLMQQADIVLYDRLVSPGVMDLVRRDADKVYVGKRRSDHAVPQTSINQLLVDHAKQGKRVLRLKGGDPFIFGRGGEEIETLSEHNIPFQIVPGITAASGCASYAGIPLTHRDHAQSVRFITGHLQSDESNLYFPELLDPKQTLVFYMGLVGLPKICAKLIEHGRDPATPAALVEKGTTSLQRVITGSILNLPDKIASHEVSAPTLVIIGDVVKLQDKLAWFNQELS